MALVRFLLVLVALVFLVSWIALPSRLSEAELKRTLVTLSIETVKGQDVGLLRTAEGESVRIACSQRNEFCAGPVREALRQATPAMMANLSRFREQRLYELGTSEKPLISAEQQEREYSSYKLAELMSVVMGCLVAAVLWFFPPGSRGTSAA